MRAELSGATWIGKVRQGDFLAIPRPFRWEDSAQFAHLVSGYEMMGGFEEIASLANERLMQAEAGKGWQGTAKELWACLFFEHRRWRHAGIEPSPRQQAFLDDLCEALRSRLADLTEAERAELLPRITATDV